MNLFTIHKKEKSYIIYILFISLTVAVAAFLLPVLNTHAMEDETGSNDDGNYVVVIDAGHGGDDPGCIYKSYQEKDMNIVVAKAMKEELEKYEGVDVYLTRQKDEELTLQERCELAGSYNADLLLCLHFNASDIHDQFGAECWVSAFGELYSKGRSFAQIEMDMLENMGLFSRGILTRRNKKGTDYYGIIRGATELGIPCVLIEHCHMDHVNDQMFCSNDKKLEELGVLDATAVAKYLQLSSKVLHVDYSHFDVPYVAEPSNIKMPKQSAPGFCEIKQIGKGDSEKVTIEISVKEYESRVIYYKYSYDGGEHYTDWLEWPDKLKDTVTFEADVPTDRNKNSFMLQVSDVYGFTKESNAIELSYTSEKISVVKGEVKETLSNNNNVDKSIDDMVLSHEAEEINENAQKKEISVNKALQETQIAMGVVILFVAVVLILSGAYMLWNNIKKKRQK